MHIQHTYIHTWSFTYMMYTYINFIFLFKKLIIYYLPNLTIYYYTITITEGTHFYFLFFCKLFKRNLLSTTPTVTNTRVCASVQDIFQMPPPYTVMVWYNDLGVEKEVSISRYIPMNVPVVYLIPCSLHVSISMDWIAGWWLKSKRGNKWWTVW